MQYRILPRTGEKLSALGYGCMRLPQKDGGIDKEAATRQIRYAIDHGVNYLDTAYMYGGSEAFLGECILKDGYREKVKVATKLPCGMISSREDMDRLFQEEMERLGLDCIDFYLLHSMNGELWDSMVSLGIIDFMSRLRETGRVCHIGFSFHGANKDFKRMIDAYDWDFVQVQFNFLDENFQAGIDGIRYAHSKSLGVMIMEPLRGGVLTHNIPQEVQDIYDHAFVKRTPAEWALRWVWNHPEITVVLSGMNEDDNVRENIRIAETALPESMSEEELTVIADVKSHYHFRIGCTGCSYCMPCPVGINIPLAFSHWNINGIEGGDAGRMFHAVMAGVSTSDGETHWVTDCRECGLCEKKCPQQLPIRESLKQLHKDMETPEWIAYAEKTRQAMQQGVTGDEFQAATN